MKTSTKKVRRNVIVIAKRFEIKTPGYKTCYNPGVLLWKGKPNQTTWAWDLTKEGFVLKHFYCYNQHEIIPLSHLKFQIVDEQTIVKRNVVKTLPVHVLNF